MVLRAKTTDLLQTRELTEKQKQNTLINKKEMQENKLILESYPQRLVLELTNACNLHCIMCGRDDINFTLTTFDINYLKKLENILDKIEKVTLFGWGEPTLHPNFKEILEYLNNFPVKKYFVTNGMRLDKIKNYLFDYKVDIMAISLDGGCASTNNRIRVGSDFDFIVKQLKEIVAIKKENNLDYPYMNFVMTLMDSNIEELPQLIKLASDIGLDEVKGVYLTVFADYMANETLYNKKEKVKKIFDEAILLGEQLNIKIKIPYLQDEDIAGDKMHKNCYVAYRDFFLGSDGYIRPCQSTPIKFFKFDETKTFEEMWNSTEYQEFRKNVNCSNKMCETCKICYQSSFANWNKKSSFLQIDKNFAPDWEK